jgi:hypothetical protein
MNDRRKPCVSSFHFPGKRNLLIRVKSRSARTKNTKYQTEMEGGRENKRRSVLMLM